MALGKKGQVLFNCFVCNPDKDAKLAILKKIGLNWGYLQPESVDGPVTLAQRPADLAAAKAKKEEVKAERATFGLTEEQIELRHGVYSFLSWAGLSEGHGRQLESRGLSAEAIKANGSFSVEKVDGGLLSLLRKASFNQPLGKVPGYTKDGLEPRRGLFIPVRNAEGRILTAQVRAGGQGKYLWLEKSQPIPHVPLGVQPGVEVWVTEEPLKADVATLCGNPCVAVPGVGLWRTILPPLRHWGSKRVVIAFDADRKRNAAVQPWAASGLCGAPGHNSGDLLAGLTHPTREARPET